MADYVWPLAATPEKFALSLFSKTVRGTSMFGRNGQNLDMLNDRWKVDATIGKREPIEGAAVEAFINSMRGGVNTVQVPHFSRPRPLGTAQQSLGLLYAAPQGAKTVSIATFAGATLLTGDLFNVDGLLLQVAADCVADASGAMVVPLVNRLRRAVAGLSRASTATYIDDFGVLQTAGVNVPRFQGGALLVEGAGTNRFLYSQGDTTALGLGTTPPTVSGGLVHLGVACSGAEFPAAGAVGFSGSRVVFTPSVTMTNNVSAAGSSWLSLSRPLVGNEQIGYYWFGCVPFIINANNSADFFGAWRRVSVADDVTATGSNQPIGYAATSMASPVTLYLCRHQWEEGSMAPTSYIPTTTAPVTRAADEMVPVTLQNPTVKCRLAPGTIVAAPFGRGGNMTGVNFELVEAIP